MAFFLNLVGKLFGSKYDKDIKEITPIVNQINKEFETLSNLTNDQLRAKTITLKKQINDFVSTEREKIQELKENSNSKELPTEKKEAIFKEIDTLEKVILEKIEEKLNIILPTAFAIVKETARRFTQNEYIEVTATENDKELATNNDFVSIKQEQAIYLTSWDAAGTEIKWDMVHYDVQLIGGIVLHQGKIAEMQTGEG